MAKRKKKKNRLAGIHIPEADKKRTLCSWCKLYIIGSVKDPVISAPTLGKGTYHWSCAQEKWRGLKEEAEKQLKKKNKE